MSALVFSTPLMWSATVTIENFTSVFEELHDKLVEAGLAVAPDTGQWDFTTGDTSVVEDKIYGYRIYKLGDGNNLDVFIKLRYSGSTSLSTGRNAWRLYVSIGLGTDGQGGLLSGSSEIKMIANSYLNLAPDIYGENALSFVSVASGFLGVSWKQRVTTFPGSYIPDPDDQVNLANFFVCRDTNDAGEPVSSGVSLVVMAPGGMEYDLPGLPPAVIHLDENGIETKTNRSSLVIGGDSVGTIGGKVPVFNMFTMTPEPKRLAQLMVARRAPGDSSNEDVELIPVGINAKPFKIMRSCWPADSYIGKDCRACIAMLWE